MRHICIWTNRVAHMGWLRLVGFSKLWVSFAKEPYKKDYILQKRPIILRSLLIVATPYQRVMLHIWTGLVIHMNEFCHAHEHVISHIWTIAPHMQARHVARTCGWVMSHTWMSHVTHMNESYRTHEWVMSHIVVSHVTHMKESYHT